MEIELFKIVALTEDRFLDRRQTDDNRFVFSTKLLSSVCPLTVSEANGLSSVSAAIFPQKKIQHSFFRVLEIKKERLIRGL